MASDLESRHRSKSRELLSKLSTEDPNEIVEEFHGLKDKIKKNLRNVIDEAKTLNLEPDEVE